MKDLKLYDIPFAGIKTGLHNFVYEIDSDFLMNFPESPLKKAKLKAFLDFYKKDDFFLLDFKLRGKVKVECDRCSELFAQPIKAKFQNVVKYAEGEEEGTKEDEEVIYISRLDMVFNVARLLYEYAILSIPLRKVHSDPEDCISDFEFGDKKTEGEEKTMDPRWERLKNIKFDQ